MKNFDQKHGLISLEKCNLETKENLYFMVQQSFKHQTSFLHGSVWPQNRYSRH